VHDDKERLAQAREEADRLGSDAAAAYVEDVRRRANVKKNPNAFD